MMPHQIPHALDLFGRQIGFCQLHGDRCAQALLDGARAGATLPDTRRNAHVVEQRRVFDDVFFAPLNALARDNRLRVAKDLEGAAPWVRPCNRKSCR